MKRQFRTFKQRGEWVELKFMAEAAARGFALLKPWGDSLAYDVALDVGCLIRVQVKSTTCRTQFGYLCQFKPSPYPRHPYTTRQLDFFAAYVLPENAWYLIPSSRVPHFSRALCARSGDFSIRSSTARRAPNANEFQLPSSLSFSSSLPST